MKLWTQGKLCWPALVGRLAREVHLAIIERRPPRHWPPKFKTWVRQMEVKGRWIRAIYWANPIITSTPNKQWESFLTSGTSTSVSVRMISYCLSFADCDGRYLLHRQESSFNKRASGVWKVLTFQPEIFFFFLFKEISERLTCVQADLNWSIYIYLLYKLT